MFKRPAFWGYGYYRSRLWVSLLILFLLPFSWLWAFCTAWRLRKSSAIASIPVLCIGNVVLGGGGKTPTTIAMAKFLIHHGFVVHCLSRGYGRSAHDIIRVLPHHTASLVGDEPILLSRVAPTWVGSDRVAMAQSAVAAGATLLLLDDGFQNPSLHKDISILVFDGGYGVGNGRVCPAGPLREPLMGAIRRADAVLVISPVSSTFKRLFSTFPRPLYTASLMPATPLAYQGVRFFAFAGIARPSKFYETLISLGANLVGTQDFGDHHAYTANDCHKLAIQAQSLHAFLITTEKDFVKIPSDFQHDVRVLPIALDTDSIDALGTFLLQRLRDLQEADTPHNPPH